MNFDYLITAKNFIILVVITIIVFGYMFLQPRKSLSVISEKIQETKKQQQTVNVDRFDLTKPLSPKEEYERIQCRDSADISSVSFKFICVHDLNDLVSQAIWKNGVWEGGHVSRFISNLIKSPNILVIDLGAQLGTFSLYAAAAGAKVLAVEPFYDNIIRLHKAASLSNLQNKIFLITNALSNKRNDIKKLSEDKNNIGGQRLKINEEFYNLTFDELKKLADGKYYVRTILLDDLIPYMPLNKFNKNYKRAIMKIDIEGFEPYAFQSASKLFDTFDIEYIMMEWGTLNSYYQERKKETDEMLNFLYDRGYAAYHPVSNEVLNKNAIMSWPWDIFWKFNY